MNCVIPYRYEKDHGAELRYAIRSLVKHFKPLEEIILVGDSPDWFNGMVIPFNDIDGRKEFSIYSKLMQVKGNVLYSNDDYFLLQDFDESFPNYYENTCGNNRNVDKTYRTLYRACPADWIDFDIHCPMIIDTTKFYWDIDRPIKTYYANQNKLPGTRYADCKIRGPQTYEDLKHRIKDRPFFSSHGNVKLSGFPKLLQELYPLPSKYESFN